MTTRLTDEQIAELERLEREATPGPWKNAYRSVRADPPDRHARSPWIADIPQGGARWREDQNCALIIEGRNALPSLLAEVRASRSSSGSGEREALEVGGAIVAWVEQELRAEDTEGTAACPGYPDKRELRSLIDRWRALSSAPPSPDSGASETP